jgi:uncharacterized protein (DUF58 family)
VNTLPPIEIFRSMEGGARALSVLAHGFRDAWRRWRHLLTRGVRQQVTFSGVVFTALMTIVGMAAFASANNLLFLLFAAMVSTLLISGLVSRLGLAGLELHIELPEHMAARRRALARLQVRNSKWIPSFSIHLRGTPASGMSTELYFPVLPAGSRIEEAVEMQFARRGVHKENEFQFSSRFPFGFTERRAGVRLDREIVIYPAIDPLPGFEVLLSDLAGDLEALQRGRGYDFYRIRPYEHLESARHVDWKASAHTGELQVREFAREDDFAITLFLDLTTPPDNAAEFERAIECCAFLLWRLSRAGSSVRLLTQQFDRTVPDNADAYDILRYLATVEPAPGAPPLPPDAQRHIYLALTSRPDAVADAGWTNDRIVDVRRLGTGDPPGDRTGAHVDHGR